jgi:hypothetical protein
MNTVLTGLQGIKFHVYLDDVVVYADSLRSHGEKFREVRKRLRDHGFKFHPDQCEFLKRSVIWGMRLREKESNLTPKR